jgi:hypothetical protein
MCPNQHNAIFKCILTISSAEELQVNLPTMTSTDKLLLMVVNQYNALQHGTEGWDGVDRPGTSIFFNAATYSRTCFNYGTKGHDVANCPKRQNPKIIKKNKQVFFDAVCQGGGRGRSGSGRGGHGSCGPKPDWSEPNADEKHNHKERCTIYGKLYYYHYKTKRFASSMRANKLIW